MRLGRKHINQPSPKQLGLAKTSVNMFSSTPKQLQATKTLQNHVFEAQNPLVKTIRAPENMFTSVPKQLGATKTSPKTRPPRPVGLYTPREAYRKALRESPCDETRAQACEDPYWAYLYALKADRKPHPTTRGGAKTPDNAYLYARDVDRKPHPTTRLLACGDVRPAFRYLKHVDKYDPPDWTPYLQHYRLPYLSHCRLGLLRDSIPLARMRKSPWGSLRARTTDLRAARKTPLNRFEGTSNVLRDRT